MVDSMAAKKTREESDGRLLTEVHVKVSYLETGLRDLQGSMKEQTATLLGALQTHASDDTTRFAEHDKRIKPLENWRWYILGIVGVLTFAMLVFKEFAVLLK